MEDAGWNMRRKLGSREHVNALIEGETCLLLSRKIRNVRMISVCECV